MSKPQILTLCLALFLVSSVEAQSREQCQRWSDQFQHLAELRRAGGSVGEMDRWRDQQRSIQSHMQKARCMQRFRITSSDS